jgi:hypothetical protein
MHIAILFGIFIAIVAIGALAHRQGEDNAIRQMLRQMHRDRRRTARLHHRTRQGIVSYPWQRRRRRLPDPNKRRYQEKK